MNRHVLPGDRLQPSSSCVTSNTPFPGGWLREPGPDDVNDIVTWLTRPVANQWFDFGLGRQDLPSLAVHAMLQSGRHRMRVFGPAGYRAPSGLVAVSDVTHRFATGSFWVLRDRSRPTCANMTRNAARHLLQQTFDHDGMRCITAWAVECNVPSHRLLAHLGFRLIGLQRDCHLIEGTRVGRLLYDLLPGELTMAACPT
ncbi:GNAT family N-acetyltransferase [Paraburkholderia kururiensis]|uniref:GNAT family N-acetyltransferase n=1 Tax=Paraburkholderia kururiensis TaxID=984307 RepID=UPI0018F5A464|nr:GNAT family protein [Paraburkholderia kururiensis]